jgi:hypothetical protein
MLDNPLSVGLLLAQRHALGRLPVPSALSSLPMLLGFGLLALAAMAVLVAMLQYRQRRNNARALHDPNELWAELCRVHRLDKIESQALRELAEARGMEPTASVFVRADLWQLDQDAAKIQHLRPQLQRLNGILFAGADTPSKVIKL